MGQPARSRFFRISRDIASRSPKKTAGTKKGTAEATGSNHPIKRRKRKPSLAVKRFKDLAQRVDVTAATGLIYVSDIYLYGAEEGQTEALGGAEQ